MPTRCKALRDSLNGSPSMPETFVFVCAIAPSLFSIDLLVQYLQTAIA